MQVEMESNYMCLGDYLADDRLVGLWRAARVSQDPKSHLSLKHGHGLQSPRKSMENNPEMESYEEKRARRVQENARVLQSLQLESVVPATSSRKSLPATSKKRKEPSEPAAEEPRRVSLRKMKLDPDGLESKEVLAKEEMKRVEEAAKAARRGGNFDMKEEFLHADDEAETEFGAFSGLAKSAGAVSDTKVEAQTRPGGANFSLQMRDDQRLRATKDRIYSMSLHPYVKDDRVLAIAGDKVGEVAFAWTPLHPDEEKRQDIYTFRIHKRPVTNMELARSAPQWVYTSSYEGSVRRMNLDTLVCEDLYGKDNTLITTFTLNTTGELCYFADTDGEMTLLDLRKSAAKPVATFAPLSDRKLSCIQLNPLDPNYIATSTLARNVSIFDIRNIRPGSKSDVLAKPLSVFDHGKSATSIYWSSDAGKLVSTSYDDTLGLFDWKIGELKHVKSIKVGWLQLWLFCFAKTDDCLQRTARQPNRALGNLLQSQIPRSIRRRRRRRDETYPGRLWNSGREALGELHVGAHHGNSGGHGSFADVAVCCGDWKCFGEDRDLVSLDFFVLL
jgi:hypothetical protein